MEAFISDSLIFVESSGAFSAIPVTTTDVGITYILNSAT